MADAILAIVFGIVIIGTFTDFFPLALAFGIAWLESRTRSSGQEGKVTMAAAPPREEG